MDVFVILEHANACTGETLLAIVGVGQICSVLSMSVRKVLDLGEKILVNVYR